MTGVQTCALPILPALLGVIAAVAVYAWVAAEPEQFAALRGDSIAGLLYVANWRFVASGQSYFDLFSPPSPLRHLWSLAIEEQFYLFWPIALTAGLRFLGRTRTVVAMVATAAVSTVLLAAISFTSIDFAYYATFTRLSGLLLGGTLAFAFTPDRIRGTAAPNARLALNVAGAVGLLILL